MALICNVAKPKEPLPTDRGSGGLGEWGPIYAENEVHVEAGSAYFAQAFAESLGLVSDIELHDTARAKLRMMSVAGLLSSALDEYRRSLQMDSETGLADHHGSLLEAAAKGLGGFDAVLRQARAQNLTGITDADLSRLAHVLHDRGYIALMQVYLDEVAAILSLAKARVPEAEEAVAWQEFVWSLNTSFSRAMAVGQAIAILNIYTFRAASAQAS